MVCTGRMLQKRNKRMVMRRKSREWHKGTEIQEGHVCAARDTRDGQEMWGLLPSRQESRFDRGDQFFSVFGGGDNVVLE